MTPRGLVLLAVALVVSGVAYLLLSSALAPTAFVSGALLLVWVAAAGISLEGRSRTSSGEATTWR